MGSRLDVMKGNLALLLLRAVQDGPRHGHEILKWIRSVTDETFLVEEGAIYPALHRLQKQKLLTAVWKKTEHNRKAKFYSLTPAGRAQLDTELAAWNRYVQTMDKALRPST